MFVHIGLKKDVRKKGKVRNKSMREAQKKEKKVWKLKVVLLILICYKREYTSRGSQEESEQGEQYTQHTHRKRGHCVTER